MTEDFGQFSDDPKTIWLDEAGPDRGMALVEAFWFTGKDAEWTVPSGYRVDGASIPRALWSLVGSPYTGDYRRASIVHDKACDDAKNEPDVAKRRAMRRAADRMFFYACRAGGCSWWDATILYIGVRIGAVVDEVSEWKQTDDDEPSPRLVQTRADLAIERDFRAGAEEVLRQGENDDAEELERRTDQAFRRLTGAPFEAF